MREIGTVASEQAARTLADYLLTRQITTRLVPSAKGEGCAVWVHREERMAEARQALDEFRTNPDDPRFVAAAPTAKQIRKEAAKVESRYRRRIRDFRDRWEGPLYHRAPLTFALMVVSGLVFCLMSVVPAIFLYFPFSAWGLGPEGELVPTGFDAILKGQAWRLVTPIFLHFGWPHLIFNMLALKAFGERIEFRKGTWRLLALVLFAAVASNVGQYLHKPGLFGGMSGVVFALGGYLWVKGHVHPEDHLRLEQQSVNWMLGWLALGFVCAAVAAGNPQLQGGFPFNMANAAHAVGLMAGMALGLFKF